MLQQEGWRLDCKKDGPTPPLALLAGHRCSLSQSSSPLPAPWLTAVSFHFSS